MRLLFTSDLHGDEAAYRRFARILAEPGYDAGVVAGDMQYDDVPKDEMIRLLGLEPGECVPEMDAPYVYPRVNFVGTRFETLLKRALAIKAEGLRRLLESAGKPVIMVRGNHDIIDWPDGALLCNIGQKAHALLGFAFVGYEFTAFHRTEEQIARELEGLRPLVDGRCVLVTHAPPFGVLDELPDAAGRLEHTGSRALREFVDGARPALHLFGHAHEAFGVEGASVNGSYLPATRGMMRIEWREERFLVQPVR
jgi:Icc-related predicted phosphoesterase